MSCVSVSFSQVSRPWVGISLGITGISISPECLHVGVHVCRRVCASYICECMCVRVRVCVYFWLKPYFHLFAFNYCLLGSVSFSPTIFIAINNLITSCHWSISSSVQGCLLSIASPQLGGGTVAGTAASSLLQSLLCLLHYINVSHYQPGLDSASGH